jgi:hypothetical protein
MSEEMDLSFKRFLASSLLSVAVLCLLAASSVSAATLKVVGVRLVVVASDASAWDTTIGIHPVPDDHLLCEAI